jgi:hypothetical protein
MLNVIRTLSPSRGNDVVLAAISNFWDVLRDVRVLIGGTSGVLVRVIVCSQHALIA